MRGRWLFWLLVVAFVWFLLARQTEFEQLVQTLVQGRGLFLLVALGLQLAYQSMQTVLLHQAFAAVRVRGRFRELLPTVLGATFVNALVSSGGVGAVAYLAHDAARRGQSPAGAAAGTVLAVIADYIAISLVLAVGISYLFMRRDLRAYEIAAAASLLLLTVLLAGVLVASFQRPGLLRRFLRLLQGATNCALRWFRRPPLVTDAWVERTTGEFATAAAGIGTRPARLFHLVGLALGGQLVNLACFGSLFIAFHQPISFGTLVAGYAMSILFKIVSPTPQGIGVVEGVVPLVLTSQGVPASKAIVVVLSFRGLSFWLPLLMGFLVQAIRQGAYLRRKEGRHEV